jgi:hypothetical protein
MGGLKDEWSGRFGDDVVVNEGDVRVRELFFKAEGGKVGISICSRIGDGDDEGLWAEGVGPSCREIDTCS